MFPAKWMQTFKVDPTFFFKRFIYLLEKQSKREREAQVGGGTEGEGERETQADCPLSTEPDSGLDLMTHDIMI